MNFFHIGDEALLLLIAEFQFAFGTRKHEDAFFRLDRFSAADVGKAAVEVLQREEHLTFARHFAHAFGHQFLFEAFAVQEFRVVGRKCLNPRLVRTAFRAARAPALSVS